MSSWDEWRDLTLEQREYSLFRVLESLDQKLINTETETIERISNCDKRFKVIENRKIFDQAKAFIGGIIGGALIILGKILFK